MALPFMEIDRNNSTFRIFREPTEEDGTLLEHEFDSFNSPVPKSRTSEIFPSTHHTYILLNDNNEVSKTFKCVSRSTENENNPLEVPVHKAKYREVLDERHRIALEERMDMQGHLEIVSIGTLSQAYTNATGNGTDYKILFSDDDGNWSDGAITLSAGTYEFSLRPLFENVPSSTNHIRVFIELTETNPSGGKDAETRTLEVWNDSDKLVITNGNMNLNPMNSFFVIKDERNLNVNVRLSGGGSDTVTVSSETEFLIKKIE